jgi:hypothetical protein
MSCRTNRIERRPVNGVLFCNTSASEVAFGRTISRRDQDGWVQFCRAGVGHCERSDLAGKPEYGAVRASRNDLWRKRDDHIPVAQRSKPDANEHGHRREPRVPPPGADGRYRKRRVRFGADSLSTCGADSGLEFPFVSDLFGIAIFGRQLPDRAAGHFSLSELRWYDCETVAARRPTG